MSETQESRKAIIGNVDGDFWLYDSESGFDLTHPSSPTATPIDNAVTIQTSTSNITIDPRKSALVVIDMQNFFLSSALGRPEESKGLEAQKKLLQYALPAARKAGIQIVWLNWGLTDDDLKKMPPATFRAFGFSSMPASSFQEIYADTSLGPDAVSGSEHLNEELGKNPRIYRGLGTSLGDVILADGSVVPAGRMLMKNQWNTKLTPPLDESFRSSSQSSKPDVWLNKSRISGLHVPGTPAGLYFQNHGIKTLFFTGVNTDQCVSGTMVDAYCQGYDCIMLRDGCATTSPAGAQECVENNAAKLTGFVTTCQAFFEGMHGSRPSGVATDTV